MSSGEAVLGPEPGPPLFTVIYGAAIASPMKANISGVNGNR